MGVQLCQKPWSGLTANEHSGGGRSLCGSPKDVWLLAPGWLPDCKRTDAPPTLPPASPVHWASSLTINRLGYLHNMLAFWGSFYWITSPYLLSICHLGFLTLSCSLEGVPTVFQILIICHFQTSIFSQNIFIYSFCEPNTSIMGVSNASLFSPSNLCIWGFEIPLSAGHKHNLLHFIRMIHRGRGSTSLCSCWQKAHVYGSQADMEHKEFCFLSFKGPYTPTGRQLDREALIKFSIFNFSEL